jgi:hypothetical protein
MNKISPTAQAHIHMAFQKQLFFTRGYLKCASPSKYWDWFLHNRSTFSYYIQWNLYLSFLDNSFSRIHCSISMTPERILFQPWLPHLLFSWIHCFFFRPLMKTMNRGFTVFEKIRACSILILNHHWVYKGYIYLEFILEHYPPQIYLENASNAAKFLGPQNV